MAVGNYGITRPADVNIEDIEVYYSYIPNREFISNKMIKIDSEEVLEYCYVDDNGETGELLEGMYNLKLPTTIFSDIGIYNVYLKPKTISINITECGILTTLPNVLGLIVQKNSLPEELRANNALQGYRVEYLDADGNKKRNVVRYIVTSNSVTKESNNMSTPNQTSNTYSFDDDGSLLFLQITPSSSYDIKPNVKPYIGNIGETILLSNTFFSPVMVEVEMVEDTIESLVDLVAGEQIKDVQKGLITHYDREREITRQFDVFKIKDSVTDVPLHEVKERRTNIDGTQSFDDIISDID